MSNILCCRNFPNVDEEDQPRDSLSRLGRGVGRSAASCIRESQLPPHPIFVITDAATDVTGLPAGIESSGVIATFQARRENRVFQLFGRREFALEMMYLDRDWKLMLNRDGEPYRLFDVKKDPPETEDLIGREEYENLNAELKSKLLDRRAQNQDV